jgi:hypothetical protein
MSWEIITEEVVKRMLHESRKAKEEPSEAAKHRRFHRWAVYFSWLSTLTSPDQEHNRFLAEREHGGCAYRAVASLCRTFNERGAGKEMFEEELQSWDAELAFRYASETNEEFARWLDTQASIGVN